MTFDKPQVSMIGTTAMLFMAPGPLDLEHQSRIWSMAATVSTWPAVEEAVPGMTNLMVVFDAPPRDPENVERALLALWSESRPMVPGGRVIEIPVTYGGEHAIDLAAVTAHAGLSVDEVVRIHSGGEYVVFAVGSSPGFAYLGGLDPRIHMPRKSVPSLRMVAGSVTIGGMQTGVAALTGPNGWNSIGFAELTVFDPSRDPPALLAPGDRVRFRAERILP